MNSKVNDILNSYYNSTLPPQLKNDEIVTIIEKYKYHKSDDVRIWVNNKPGKPDYDLIKDLQAHCKKHGLDRVFVIGKNWSLRQSPQMWDRSSPQEIREIIPTSSKGSNVITFEYLCPPKRLRKTLAKEEWYNAHCYDYDDQFLLIVKFENKKRSSKRTKSPSSVQDVRQDFKIQMTNSAIDRIFNSQQPGVKVDYVKIPLYDLIMRLNNQGKIIITEPIKDPENLKKNIVIVPSIKAPPITKIDETLSSDDDQSSTSDSDQNNNSKYN